MNFCYRFPVVKGLQAGKEYYIAMVPLKMISALFPNDEEYVLPEHRAQRKLNESRIPDIKRYMLDNRDTYVFSALAASIDGKYKYIPSEQEELGILEVAMDAHFLINDGQHRKAAILAAVEEDPSLGDETISVVFYEDQGLQRSQQMFTDLNKHAVKTSNSIAELYDSRDELAVHTRAVVNAVPFFDEYVDKEKDGIYTVEGPRIERMLGYTNLESEKGFVFFQNFMREQGILDQLKELGIAEGDIVRVYGHEFEYYDD